MLGKCETRHTNPQTGLIAIILLAALLGNVATASGEGRFARTEDDVKVYYEAVGSGVPIVFIAGGPGGSSKRFRRTHMLLQPYAQLVFLDNRGRGRSQDVGHRKGAYSLYNDLKDVEAVRKALGAEKIIVFGHSYGSMVAMAYATRFPQHTLALITTAGMHGARVWQERNIDGVKRFLQYQYPKRWKRIVALHDAGKLTSKGELASMFRDIDELYAYNPESEERLHAQADEYNDPKSVTFNTDVYEAIIGKDPEWEVTGTLRGVELLPELANFTGPALIMGGRYDRICPPINQVEIAEALRNAKLVIFEHSGHAPSKEEPLRFLSVVSQFLREVTETD
ncbi:MAG: alpha/beta hydrolase [Phycisphaerales bacterium]|nr:MAG: alpha/beta hydrolase [Phycisphaerales bacterium]